MVTGRTDCGMMYAVKRSGSAVAYCALSIKCGTRDEGGYYSGIAHFVEHTIFKGTLKKSSAVINSYLDKLGGELNAYTTKEEIVLYATVLKEDLLKAASLLLELATSPVFPEDEIRKEKGVVLDEINSYKDSPSEEIYDKFEELLFSGHPLAGPILGTASSVRKIRRDDLLSFVSSKFVPENMAFTVVADFSEPWMEKKIVSLSGRFFGAGKNEPERQCYPPVKLDSRFDLTVNRRNHQVNCVIGNYAPTLYAGRERTAVLLLCNILGGPASNSILNSVLREKNGWVYGVECSYTQYADTGVAAVSFGCDKSNHEKCLHAIRREIGKLQDDPISPARLKAAKKQFLGQLAVASDNGESQCLSMGKSLLSYGEVISSGQMRGQVESVTSMELQGAARSVFDAGSCSSLTYL